MLIPPSLWKGKIQDVDVNYLFQLFDELPGAKVLDVGCHDESGQAAMVMHQAGFKVYGIDLREQEESTQEIHYLRADFCDLPGDWLREHLQSFDAVVSISALEHFGMGAYGEHPFHEYYDVLASRQAWQLLKEGGHFYLTVPFGRRLMELIPHWRVYDARAFMDRLVQDFTPVSQAFFFSAEAPNCDLTSMYQAGQIVPFDVASLYPGSPPHCTILAKVQKKTPGRKAPDGR